MTQRTHTPGEPPLSPQHPPTPGPAPRDRLPLPDRLPLRDGQGPAFRAPWEARVFALAVQLCERERFTWSDFSARLAVRIAAARERGETDDGSRYYEYWLGALEELVAPSPIEPPRRPDP